MNQIGRSIVRSRAAGERRRGRKNGDYAVRPSGPHVPGENVVLRVARRKHGAPRRRLLLVSGLRSDNGRRLLLTGRACRSSFDRRDGPRRRGRRQEQPPRPGHEIETR